MFSSSHWLMTLFTIGTLGGCNGVLGVHRHDFEEGVAGLSGNESEAGNVGATGPASRGGGPAAHSGGSESAAVGKGGKASGVGAAGASGIVTGGTNSVAGASSGVFGGGNPGGGLSASQPNGGVSTSAAVTAGVSAAGKSSGGATSVAAAGGAATGGVATGGAATGGVATGGVATGGNGTGGSLLGVGGGNVCTSVPPGLSGATLVNHLPADWASTTTAGICRKPVCHGPDWEDLLVDGQNCLCVWGNMYNDRDLMDVDYPLPTTSFSKLKLQIIGTTQDVAVYLKTPDNLGYCSRLGATSGLASIDLNVSDFGDDSCWGSGAVPTGTTFSHLIFQVFRDNGTPTSFGFCVTDISLQ